MATAGKQIINIMLFIDSGGDVTVNLYVAPNSIIPHLCIHILEFTYIPNH